jgi:hypothetical protein
VARGVQNSFRIAWDTFPGANLPEVVAASQRMERLNRKLQEHRYHEKACAVPMTLNTLRWCCDVRKRDDLLTQGVP